MFIIKLADISIGIDNRFEFTKEFCKDYIIETDQYDFKVSVNEEEILKQKNEIEVNAPDDFTESICIYRKIAQELPKYNAFVFHGASVEVNQKAYCFTAKSGTGKTTHISLWKKVFGDKVNIINGDKPIIRLIDNKFYVYGTPWSGKENLNRNVHFPLKSICFINQSKINSIEKLTSHQALNKILHQIYLPQNKIDLETTLDLLGRLLQQTDLYNLNCNISDEAAELSFNVMTKEDYNEH